MRAIVKMKQIEREQKRKFGNISRDREVCIERKQRGSNIKEDR